MRTTNMSVLEREGSDICDERSEDNEQEFGGNHRYNRLDEWGKAKKKVGTVFMEQEGRTPQNQAGERRH